MAHLVRSLELTPENFSHDWHVQPIVKDRIAFRLSGALPVRAESQKCESACPRNLTKLPWPVRHCQLTGITGLPQDLHIVEEVNRFNREELFQFASARQTTTSAWKVRFLGTSRGGSR